MTDPEIRPWYGGVLKGSASEGPDAYLFSGDPYGPRWVRRNQMELMHPDDGRRVVAAWNATRHIPIEQLEAEDQKAFEKGDS